MATEYKTIVGKAYWFKHVHPDAKFDPPTWRYVHYPDTASLELIRELQGEGVKNVLKKDENGYNVNIKRPTHIIVRGSVQGMQPPLITYQGQPYIGGVGNGSDVTTVLEVYSHRVPNTTKMAKAMRWHSTRIDNLIPYEMSIDLQPADLKNAQHIINAPLPAWQTEQTTLRT